MATTKETFSIVTEPDIAVADKEYVDENDVSIRASIATISDTISSLTENLDDILDGIHALDGKIDGVVTATTAVSNSITRMSNSVDNMTTAVNGITNTLATINTNIGVMNANVNSTGSKIDTATGNINAMNSNLTGMRNSYTDTRAGYLDLLVNETYGLQAIRGQGSLTTRCYVPSNTRISSMEHYTGELVNPNAANSLDEHAVSWKVSGYFLPVLKGTVRIQISYNMEVYEEYTGSSYSYNYGSFRVFSAGHSDIDRSGVPLSEFVWSYPIGHLFASYDHSVSQYYRSKYIGIRELGTGVVDAIIEVEAGMPVVVQFTSPSQYGRSKCTITGIEVYAGFANG